MKTKNKPGFPCYFGKPVQDKLRSYLLAELDCIETRVAIIRGIVKGDDAMYLHSIRVETKEGIALFDDVQRNIDRYLHRCRCRLSKPKALKAPSMSPSDSCKHKILAYMQDPESLEHGVSGSSELRDCVFNNRKKVTKIRAWLEELREQGLVRSVDEVNSQGNTVKRWFATKHSNGQ